MDKKQISDISLKIIQCKEHGKEFYDKVKYIELIDKVSEIIDKLDLLNGDDYEKITKVNEFLKKNVSVRKSYFDAFREEIPEIPQDELVYRTAYGALSERNQPKACIK